MSYDAIFNATRQQAESAAEYGEVVTAVTDVRYGTRARIPGNAAAYVVLEAEDLRDGFVKVLWRCGSDDKPPAPFTVFRAEEYVLCQ